MAQRMCSYCGTFYWDTEKEQQALGRGWPVGPHPYKVCLAEQEKRLWVATRHAATIEQNIKHIRFRIMLREGRP